MTKRECSTCAYFQKETKKCRTKFFDKPYVAPWQRCEEWEESIDVKQDIIRRKEEAYSYLVKSWSSGDSISSSLYMSSNYTMPEGLKEYIRAGGKDQGLIDDLSFLIEVGSHYYERDYHKPKHVYHFPYGYLRKTSMYIGGNCRNCGAPLQNNHCQYCGTTSLIEQ